MLVVLAVTVAVALSNATHPLHVSWAWHGILQSAGLLFFAFAGYARIATMGEEVRDPERTIPRAILVALAIAVAVYAAVGVALLLRFGPEQLATLPAPLAAAWPSPVVRVGAAVASLGALLALIAGVGRTTLAMAREGDLPRWLAAVHPRYKVPHRAEVVLAVVVSALILVFDVRAAIGFSSFGVLLYYLVANLAAYTQRRRRFPRGLQVLGAAGCVTLVASLPLPSILAGALVFVVGVGYRLVIRR